MNEKTKGVLSLSLRLTIAVIIIYLLTSGQRGVILRTIYSANPKWFILAVLCFVASFLVCIARWHSLLKTQGIDLSFWDTFVLAMQGMFFSLIIPGAVGGDLAKAGFISAKTGAGSKTKAVFSILIDRIIGLLGLFVLAAILGLACFNQISGFAYSARLVLLILIFGIILCLFAVAILFFHRTFEKIPLIKCFLDIADKYGRGLPSRLMEALDGYRQSYLKILSWILLSAFFVHSLQGLAVYCLVEGAGEGAQKPHYVLLSSSLANAVGAIPLTPSGLGTRDAVLSTLLSSFGMGKEKSLSVAIMNTALILLFNLLAGVFFIFASGKKS